MEKYDQQDPFRAWVGLFTVIGYILLGILLIFVIPIWTLWQFQGDNIMRLFPEFFK